MPKRLIKKGITVVRDGKRVRPEVGKTFNLTQAEIANLEEVDASALGKASEADDAEGEATAATSSAQQSQAKASGGKKKATAGKSDAENAEDGDDGEPPAGEGGGPGAGSDDDL